MTSKNIFLILVILLISFNYVLAQDKCYRVSLTIDRYGSVSFNNGHYYGGNIKIDGEWKSGTIPVDIVNVTSIRDCTSRCGCYLSGTTINFDDNSCHGANGAYTDSVTACGPLIKQDLDKDGFYDDVDCDDNNPDIYPGAIEYCDGIDSNCDGNADSDLFNKILVRDDKSYLCTYESSNDPDFDDTHHYIQKSDSYRGFFAQDTPFNIYSLSYMRGDVGVTSKYFSDNITGDWLWYVSSIAKTSSPNCGFSYCFNPQENKCVKGVSHDLLDVRFPFDNSDSFDGLSIMNQDSNHFDVCVINSTYLNLYPGDSSLYPDNTYSEVHKFANWTSLYSKKSQFGNHAGYCNLESQCYYYDDATHQGQCLNNLQAPSAVTDLLCQNGVWGTKTGFLYSNYLNMYNPQRDDNLLDDTFSLTCNYANDISECISYGLDNANFIDYGVLDHNNFDPTYFIKSKYNLANVQCLNLDSNDLISKSHANSVFNCTAKKLCGFLCFKKLNVSMMVYKYNNFSIYHFAKNISDSNLNDFSYLGGLVKSVHYNPNYYLGVQYYTNVSSILNLSRMNDDLILQFGRRLSHSFSLSNSEIGGLNVDLFPYVIEGNDNILNIFKRNMLGVSYDESFENKELSNYNSGYFKYVDCLFDDDFYSSLYPLFDQSYDDRIAFQGSLGYEKEFGCCSKNECWNGTQCIDGFDKNSIFNLNSVTSNKFRFDNYSDINYICVKNNTWKRSNLNYNFDHSSKGYCFNNNQCWVNDSYGCINSGSYYGNAYCSNGTYVSRLSFNAMALLNASDIDLNDYTLYCDDSNKSLNDNSFGFTNIDDKVSGVCVLDYNKKTVFAFSLNKDVDVNYVIDRIKLENSNDISYDQYNDISYCTNNPNDGNFYLCGSNNHFWFNNKTKTVIVSKGNFEFNKPNVIKQFFTWLFNTPIFSNSKELDFISKYAITSTKLYIQKDVNLGNLFSSVSYDNGTLISYNDYFNLDADICTLLGNITNDCMYKSTNNEHVFDFNYTQHSNYWSYLSSKVRLKSGNDFNWFTCTRNGQTLTGDNVCCDDLIAYQESSTSSKKCSLDSDSDGVPDEFDSCVDVKQGDSGCMGCPNACECSNPCQCQVLSCASGSPVCVDYDNNCPCKDSDGGQIYSVKGTLNFKGTNFVDYCNGNNLHEYSCVMSDVLDNVDYAENNHVCANGCTNGKCN